VVFLQEKRDERILAVNPNVSLVEKEVIPDILANP